MSRLTLTDIEFAYPGMTAPIFANLTLQFPAAWTGIVGPNGSGKTTLLQIVTGKLPPQHGTLNIDGKALYLAQRTDNPPPHLEDFMWAPDAQHLKSRLRIADDFSDRWQTLSHGERKRAQIAVALWQEPDILALDEPTNHIDADARRLLIDTLRDYPGIGLLVSHDRELLDELCANTLLIEPPLATLRPGNITHALTQQNIEEQTALNEDNTLRQAAARLRAEAQRRRVQAEQKAAASRASVRKSKHDNDARNARNLAKLTGRDAHGKKLAAQIQQRAAQTETARSSLQIKKHYETGIWLDQAAHSPRDFLLRLPATQIPLTSPHHNVGASLDDARDATSSRPPSSLSPTPNKDGARSPSAPPENASQLNHLPSTQSLSANASAPAITDNPPPNTSVPERQRPSDFYSSPFIFHSSETPRVSRALTTPALAIGGADRIALTGANGLGKSTLIRHILSKIQIPADKLIYIPQEIPAPDAASLLDQIKKLPNAERGRIMTTISRLGSRPARLLESAQPSPGETRKLLLALGIIRSPHLIIMDEPTNHMDLPGILCLEDALAECPCAMLLVSHDQNFLAKTTRIHWHITQQSGQNPTLQILPSPASI